MAEFKGGVKGAAELLAHMDTRGRERILKEIGQKDPDMAETLRKNMVTFEDLRHMTPQMLAKLLQEIDLSDVALGLRLGSDELKSFFFQNMSKGRQQEIQDVLMGPPQSVNKVEEAIERVMDVVRQKMDKGEIVLDPNGDEYV